MHLQPYNKNIFFVIILSLNCLLLANLYSQTKKELQFIQTKVFERYLKTDNVSDKNINKALNNTISKIKASKNESFIPYLLLLIEYTPTDSDVSDNAYEVLIGFGQKAIPYICYDIISSEYLFISKVVALQEVTNEDILSKTKYDLEKIRKYIRNNYTKWKK